MELIISGVISKFSSILVANLVASLIKVYPAFWSPRIAINIGFIFVSDTVLIIETADALSFSKYISMLIPCKPNILFVKAEPGHLMFSPLNMDVNNENRLATILWLGQSLIAFFSSSVRELSSFIKFCTASVASWFNMDRIGGWHMALLEVKLEKQMSMIYVSYLLCLQIAQ